MHVWFDPIVISATGVQHLEPDWQSLAIAHLVTTLRVDMHYQNIFVNYFYTLRTECMSVFGVESNQTFYYSERWVQKTGQRVATLECGLRFWQMCDTLAMTEALTERQRRDCAHTRPPPNSPLNFDLCQTVYQLIKSDWSSINNQSFYWNKSCVYNTMYDNKRLSLLGLES